jgi:GT2 family glycosyltransferase
MSDKVTLIIPVRRDADKLERSLRSVLSGTLVPRIIVMDCTADPEILGKTREKFPGVRFFDLGMNPGRAHAVNTGFHITQTPYVMTLSPGLVAGKHCVEKLCAALDNDPDLLSAQAKILTAEEPPRISGAGWLLDLSAEPVIRGAGRSAASCSRKTGITAAQMDAAIYRMEYLEVTGILDERFYTRLEDLDLGYRGLIAGFKNVCEPAAKCREMESTPANSFYEQLETGNMEYFRYKYGLKGIRLPESKDKKEDPQRAAALERGRMLCFQAEIEQMEKEELGMSVTKLTLPEEFYMEIREDGPKGVFPLYVGSKAEESPLQIPDLLSARAGMLAGVAERARRLFERRSLQNGEADI